MTVRELRSKLFNIEEQDTEITLEDLKKIMEPHAFELFGGCLGNGTTVCNKAVMEYGDYKNIAHISDGGLIKWYIPEPEKYVPEDAMKKIQEWADAAHEKFMADWNRLTDIQKYSKMLERIPFGALMVHPMKNQLKACTDLHEKVQLLEKIYFEKYI